MIKYHHSTEEIMEIARYIQEAAENALKFDTVLKLPLRLAETDFYLAEANDQDILAHSSIQHGDKEYKIGTRREVNA
ncbi:MAG: hypothetical protein JWN37_316 [Candidatus Nomurabacteria bacterium]|nr:hypothetical protein [Candidatus Nomurabacteria bacterium]